MTHATDVIVQMEAHRSIRAYKTEPLGRELIEMIIGAGQRAATSSNLQQYSVVVVQDAAKRAKMAELCGNQKHIGQAPVFLAWCADLSRLARVAARRGLPNVADGVENFLVSAVDVALVMQNATLAAESLGLGTCYIGAIRNDTAAVIDLLDLPPLVFPIAGMTVGWPAEEPMIKPRLPLEGVVHWESYGVDEAGETAVLEAYDETIRATGLYAGRQVKVKGVVETEVADYSWQAHSARRTAYAKRREMREVLAKQGFLLK